MKPLVCYHRACMDGAGSALAAYLNFGEEAEYRAVGYGDPAPTDDECRGRDVYVLDFSWPRAELQRIDAAVNDKSDPFNTAKLVVLDHHKSAQKELDDLPFCTFDMGKSGAAMAWEFFHCSGLANPREDSRLPGLIRYIQDRDLWEWKLPYGKEISAALFSTGATDDFRKLRPIHEEWDAYEGDSHSFAGTRDTSSKSRLIRAGEAILATEAQMVTRCVSTAEEVVLDGHRCLAVSCPLLQSEVGEALAIESARRGGSPIGVVWHRYGERGTFKVSLRSRDCTAVSTEPCIKGAVLGKILAPDVSAIAKKVGDGGTGGGHHKAAGFECKTLPWMILDGNITAMAMAWQEVWKKLEQKGMLESFGHFSGIGRALAFIEERIK